MAPSILVDESQYLKSQLDLLRRELEQQVATSREAAELATQKIKLKDQWINHLENANTAANTGGNEIVELHAKGRELQGQVVALNERNIDLEEKASMLEEKSSALQEKNSTLKDRNRILVERNRALEEEASALECEIKELRNLNEIHEAELRGLHSDNARLKRTRAEQQAKIETRPQEMLVDRRGASNSGTNGHTTNPFRELGANVRAYDTESTNEFTAQTPMRNAVEVQSAVDRGIRGFYYDQQGDRAEVEAEILPFTLADFQRTKGMGVKVYNRVKSGDISHCLHQMNKQGKVKWSLEHGDRVACGTCTNQTRLCAYFGDGIVWVRPLLSTFRKGNPTESTFWVRSQRDKMEMSWTPRNLWQVFPQTGKKRQRI